jgi:hypothetical protein
MGGITMAIGSRQLAEKFEVNHQTLKRWARAFLPPDPIAGRQCGKERQFELDDAFTLFLAGHLVSILKFSMEETRRILKDIVGWLKSKNIHPYADTKTIGNYEIQIMPCFNPEGFFVYEAIRWIDTRQTGEEDGATVYRITCSKERISVPERGNIVHYNGLSLRLLQVTSLIIEFRHRMGSSDDA